MKIVVSRLDEFPPGERRIVRAGRRSIGVFRVGDRFYAINNHCPHMGGPLCLGRTKPWVSSTGPGEYEMAGEEALVACPWHGWEYDLETGQSFLGPGEPPARTYPVSVEPGVEAGTITADEVVPPRTGVKGGRRPGPYVTETFPVRVEDAYVVVETSPRPAPVPGPVGGAS
ncbi:Rieske 2Fe-2S domain-containing protein [Amycolatopsis sp. FDAARGOS 1241]|uniref:Rieske 2Fe-2S domain-containing protein n=1 Tax=Amycolatopsis sp. FDAARGOS 1241 TaxID=2778070 RepID=UPI00194DBADC|nr:Rieske 2Fe-2S domain-containing protein [Amycolatopsis sp. FDAARGOS 1241]QRP50262.1 Rieske 2Fe-2S domain-containing protein [Amycolatopsis sp. FDAARGOS 1241]